MPGLQQLMLVSFLVKPLFVELKVQLEFQVTKKVQSTSNIRFAGARVIFRLTMLLRLRRVLQSRIFAF